MSKTINGQISSMQVGENGADIYNDANAHTGNWFAIQFVADSIFDAITSNYTGTMTAITFSKGLIIYGAFSSVELASGTIICYRR